MSKPTPIAVKIVDLEKQVRELFADPATHEAIRESVRRMTVEQRNSMVDPKLLNKPTPFAVTLVKEIEAGLILANIHINKPIRLALESMVARHLSDLAERQAKALVVGFHTEGDVKDLIAILRAGMETEK